MAWSMCSSEAAIAHAGANANSTMVASSAGLALISDEIEGFINFETRQDWITTPPTTNFVGVLNSVASRLIANDIIAYDMSGYTSRTEAQTMLDVNHDLATRGLAILKKEEYKEKAK